MIWQINKTYTKPSVQITTLLGNILKYYCEVVNVNQIYKKFSKLCTNLVDIDIIHNNIIYSKILNNIIACITNIILYRTEDLDHTLYAFYVYRMRIMFIQ